MGRECPLCPKWVMGKNWLGHLGQAHDRVEDYLPMHHHKAKGSVVRSIRRKPA